MDRCGVSEDVTNLDNILSARDPERRCHDNGHQWGQHRRDAHRPSGNAAHRAPNPGDDGPEVRRDQHRRAGVDRQRRQPYPEEHQKHRHQARTGQQRRTGHRGIPFGPHPTGRVTDSGPEPAADHQGDEQPAPQSDSQLGGPRDLRRGSEPATSEVRVAQTVQVVDGHRAVPVGDADPRYLVELRHLPWGELLAVVGFAVEEVLPEGRLVLGHPAVDVDVVQPHRARGIRLRRPPGGRQVQRRDLDVSGSVRHRPQPGLGTEQDRADPVRRDATAGRQRLTCPLGRGQ